MHNSPAVGPRLVEVATKNSAHAGLPRSPASRNLAIRQLLPACLLQWPTLNWAKIRKAKPEASRQVTMRIVYLSDCGPFDVYLIRRLQEHQPIAAIVRVVGSGSMALTPARRKEFRRAPLRTSARWAERFLFYRRFRRHIQRQLSCRLFGSPVPPTLANCLDLPLAEINAPGTVQLLQSLAPDVLVVSSAPLLKPAIYSTARIGAINVHRGIAPAYRGESTLFWAMYFADYEKLGVTVHYLDEGIDTGAALAQGFSALAESDSEATLLAKGSQIAAELLLEFFAAAGRSRPQGQSLSGPSRLFQARDRRIWHDAQLWFRQKVLRRALPTRPCSKTVYF